MDTDSDLIVQKFELKAWIKSNSKTICAKSYIMIKDALDNLKKD